MKKEKYKVTLTISRANVSILLRGMQRVIYDTLTDAYHKAAGLQEQWNKMSKEERRSELHTITYEGTHDECMQQYRNLTDMKIQSWDKIKDVISKGLAKLPLPRRNKQQVDKLVAEKETPRFDKFQSFLMSVGIILTVNMEVVDEATDRS